MARLVNLQYQGGGRDHAKYTADVVFEAADLEPFLSHRGRFNRTAFWAIWEGELAKAKRRLKVELRREDERARDAKTITIATMDWKEAANDVAEGRIVHALEARQLTEDLYQRALDARRQASMQAARNRYDQAKPKLELRIDAEALDCVREVAEDLGWSQAEVLEEAVFALYEAWEEGELDGEVRRSLIRRAEQ